jgi:hypothetical protein
MRYSVEAGDCEGREQIRGFGNVKRQYGFNTVRHVKGRKAEGLANSNPLCPEDLGQDIRPLRLLIAASSHDGLADVVVLSFDQSIRLLAVC